MLRTYFRFLEPSMFCHSNVKKQPGMAEQYKLNVPPRIGLWHTAILSLDNELDRTNMSRLYCIQYIRRCKKDERRNKICHRLLNQEIPAIFCRIPYSTSRWYVGNSHTHSCFYGLDSSRNSQSRSKSYFRSRFWNR